MTEKEKSVNGVGNSDLRTMLERAVSIMGFHTGRCPMNIMDNYSGMEEHLAEYRAVMKEGKALLDAKSGNSQGNAQ